MELGVTVDQRSVAGLASWLKKRMTRGGETVSAKHDALEKVTDAVRATETVAVGPFTGERIRDWVVERKGLDNNSFA